MSRVQPVVIERVGGALCLDFVNTVDPRYAPERTEFLLDYEALLTWALGANLVESAHAEMLAAVASSRPSSAQTVHRRAIALREAIFEIFRDDPRFRARGLRTLNDELRRAPQHQLVELGDGRVARVWPSIEALDRILWPIAASAADLLTSDVARRVRECEGERCGWLFLDTSKAGHRRWCSMGDCGNRAKARRRRDARRGRKAATTPR